MLLQAERKTLDLSAILRNCYPQAHPDFTIDGIHADSIVFVYELPARLNAQGEQHLLSVVEAFRDLCLETGNKRLRLLLAVDHGDGSIEERIDQLVEKALADAVVPDIVLIDIQDAANRLSVLRLGHTYISLSTDEELNESILQAMALNRHLILPESHPAVAWAEEVAWLAPADSPVEALTQAMHSRLRLKQSQNRHALVNQALLHVSRLQELAVELTTSCNLRCVYCQFAPMSRRGQSATAETVEALIDFCKTFPVETVSMSGDAEITLFQGWHEVANRLLNETSVKLRTISNFSARLFSPEEVDTFSKFSEIVISLDTNDASLLKKVRFGADLRTITLNLQQIRAKALMENRSQLKIVCNVVVHDKNIFHLDELAAFAIANGFHVLQLQRYVALDEVLGGKNDHMDNPKATPVAPLSSLSPEQIEQAWGVLHRLQAICHNRIQLSMHPLLTQEIEHKTAEIPEGTRLTKDCLFPWYFMLMFWNGDVPPCCIVKDRFIDNAGERPLAEIFNGENMQAYRKSLLSGDLMPECQRCTYVPDTNTRELRQRVRHQLGIPE